VDGGSQSTNTGRGIYLLNDLSGNVLLDTVSIINVTVKNFGHDGIAIVGANGSSGWNHVTISNTVCSANRDGIQSYASASGAHQNVLIDHVTAHDNPGLATYTTNWSGSGIVLGQVNGATIQYCIAYNNGTQNGSTNGPVGIWCWGSNNVMIQYCESYGNSGGVGYDGDGFDLDINTTNSTLQYNYSHDNTGAGYLFGGQGTTGGNVIQYNISQNDGLKNGYGGIETWGTVYNVTVNNNWVFSRAIGATGIRILGGATVSNVTFRNNIIVVTGSLPIVQADTTSGSVFTGNDYWRIDGSFLLSWGGISYTSLAAWKTATGQEAGTGFNSSPPQLLLFP
jgi:hypothetical protein